MSFEADGKPTLYRELVQAAYGTADRRGVDVETTPEWRAAQIIGNLSNFELAMADTLVGGTGFLMLSRLPPDTVTVKTK